MQSIEESHTEVRLRAVRDPAAAWMWAALALAGALLLAKSMGERLDHDEHQFVASAALLARRGLLPYRDYPYFHTPYLVFVYAGLYRLTGHLLLAARLMSVGCSITCLTLIAMTVRRLFAPASAAARSTAVVASVLLIAANPFFASTTGLAWNHDLSELLLVAAALLYLSSLAARDARPRDGWLVPFGVGLLVALAAGVRLTAAPTLAAFVGMTLARRDWRPSRRLAAAGWLLGGVALGLLPCAALAGLAPRAFWFGNFEYPTFNTAWRLAEGAKESTTSWGKVAYVADSVIALPGNALLLALTVFIVLLAARRIGLRNHPYRRELTFLGLLLLFMAVAALAPAPLFAMYFFAPVPFIVLLGAYAAAPMCRRDAAAPGRRRPAARFAPGRRRPALWPAVLALVTIATGARHYEPHKLAFRPSAWVPLQAHALGAELRRRIGPRAGERPILTLAPIYPLEAGMDVYEPYATGPFAMRVAAMVPEDDEAPLHLMDEEDLRALMRERPPAAVVAGFEGPDDVALLRAGRDAGARLIWLRPSGRTAIVDDRANVHGRAFRSLREHEKEDDEK